MPDREHSVRKQEVFIGLVGAAGTDLESVRTFLAESLREVGYASYRVRLSELLHGINKGPWSELPDGGPEDVRIDRHMDAGDELRRKLRRGDALAGLAVMEVRDFRQAESGQPDQAVLGTAYVLDSLKHPAEVHTLRDIYGPAFILISAYCPSDKRIDVLARRIAESRNSPNPNDWRDAAERLRKKDEFEPGDLYGQNVRGTFPLADVFVDASDADAVRKSVERLVETVFGYPFHTPTRDEYGMFLAWAAALRSADLSRQVGAAIATDDGDIIAVGTNEVPRARGGLYWAEDACDRRDFRWGKDTSTRMKESMLKELLSCLQESGRLAADLEREDADELYEICRKELKDTQVMQVGEFGRSVHAEMAAIADAARRGVALRGTVLYTTTFPCHNCAKHIVAAGIERVVYIEPYPKSRARELHSDSISIDGSATDAEHPVVFKAFVGVAPRRYIDWFTMPEQRQDQAGKPLAWDRAQARPIWAIDAPRLAYIAEEQGFTRMIEQQLREKKLLPAQ